MITIAAASSNWIWYFGRATGFVALILFTAIIVLGVAGRMRLASERWPRFVVGTMHRDLALIALIVLGVHIAASILDTYVSIPVIAAVVPFTSNYQPFWVGLGALAVDVMLAVIITSLLRRHIGLRVWKAIHWLNYALWPVAVAHTIGIGSDTGSAWGMGLTIVCCVIVAAAVAARVVSAPASDTPLVTTSPVGVAVTSGSRPHTGSAQRVRASNRVAASAGRVSPAERTR
jgi:predicted ferric reductase